MRPRETEEKSQLQYRGSFEQDSKKPIIDTDSEYVYNAFPSEHLPPLVRTDQTHSTGMGELDSSLFDTSNNVSHASHSTNTNTFKHNMGGGVFVFPPGEKKRKRVGSV